MSIPNIPRQKKFVKRPRVPYISVCSTTGQVLARVPFNTTAEELLQLRAQLGAGEPTNVVDQGESAIDPARSSPHPIPADLLDADFDLAPAFPFEDDAWAFNEASDIHSHALSNNLNPVDPPVTLPVFDGIHCIHGSGSRFQLHVLPPDNGRTMNICVAVFAVDYSDGTRMVACCSSCPNLQQELQATYEISGHLPVATAPTLCRCPHITATIANMVWLAGNHSKTWDNARLQEFLVSACTGNVPETPINTYTNDILPIRNIFVIVTSNLQMRLFKRTAKKHFLCLTCGKARKADCSHLAECGGLLKDALESYPYDGDSDPEDTGMPPAHPAVQDTSDRPTLDFFKEYLLSKKPYARTLFDPSF
jgi:hypothetical protein